MGVSKELYLKSLRRTIALAISCIVIGFCVQLAAVFSPAWLTADDSKEKTSWTLKEGIWLARFCRLQTNECFTGKREAILEKIGAKGSLSRMYSKPFNFSLSYVIGFSSFVRIILSFVSFKNY